MITILYLERTLERQTNLFKKKKLEVEHSGAVQNYL